MALEIIRKRLTLDEYVTQRKNQDKGTGKITKATITNAELFCMDQYNLEFTSVMTELREDYVKSRDVEASLVFLQKFINWMSEPHLDLRMTPNVIHKNGAKCIAKDVTSIRGYVIQTRLILRKVGGIKISTEDVKDYNLSYPKPIEKELPIPLSLDEFRLICDTQQNFRRKMLYLIKKDCEARIGAMVQLRKKWFNTNTRPIQVTFPASIMKKKNGISFTNIKYVIKENEKGLLKLLDQYSDEDLVFGNNEKVEYAENNEQRAWCRLLEKLGMDERYKHSGKLKKGLHSIKALTFTAARKAVDLDYAHAYGDHADYCKNYLRLSDEEKIDYFKRLEPFISIYTKTVEIHDNEKLHKENMEMKKKFANYDVLIEKLSEELHDIQMAKE